MKLNLELVMLAAYLVAGSWIVRLRINQSFPQKVWADLSIPAATPSAGSGDSLNSTSSGMSSPSGQPASSSGTASSSGEPTATVSGEITATPAAQEVASPEASLVREKNDPIPPVLAGSPVASLIRIPLLFLSRLNPGNFYPDGKLPYPETVVLLGVSGLLFMSGLVMVR